MAIYKPTDCSPFNGTFDLSADLPIVFECKIDTSNSPVTGYSIEIYNSNNEIIFPGVNRTTGPIKSNVTYLTDLKKYVQNKFPSLVSNIRNVNSGLNGTILEIPAIVNSSDIDNNTTVGRNQIGIISGETNILVDGQTYMWKITLYQSATTDNSIFPPDAEKYYDMTVASGTVIGSNEKRIQTALIDSDDRVVNNLVLIDKFVQPIKINDFNYDPSDPVTKWTGTVPTTFTMTRSLITGYDSTYGYVYPSTAEGNAFADGQIVPENANGFQIFKNGNNPSNLGATDMVDFIYDSGEFEGEMTWKTSEANPEQSYWEQIYSVDSDPNGVFYPLKGDGYSSFALTGSERIIFNHIDSEVKIGSAVQYGGIYYGSPYNGIFEPRFSSKKTDGETPAYQVTVVWNRTSDAANWGTLSNKIVYCRRDGKNYEINTTTQAGEINKTPFKFVEEKPVRIFDTAAKMTNTVGDQDIQDIGNNSRIFNTNSAISSILSVTNNNSVDVTKDCAFEVGKNYIIYTSSSAIPSNLTVSVKYIPFNIQDYTGIIFYNKRTATDSDTGTIYIRPSININKNMIFKEVTTTINPTWFNISYFNKDYNYITYTGNTGFNPEIDKTRYQIKSFYKDSDYNPFSIYKNPEIISTISGNIINSDGATNAITTRNFTVTSTYSQNSYIQWKSYQWILYDSAKRAILEKTGEQYDGEITATFYGLDPQQYYILSLILQTNTGKIIEIDYVIYSNFTETAEQRDLVDAEFDCDTLSMKASLKKLPSVVLAPDANEYLSGTPSTTENTVGTAYYYNSKSNFYKKDNQTIASIDNGVLTITGQNSLDFSKSFDQYDLIRAKTGDIQTNADEIVVEGSFDFSKDYNGDIFSVSRGEEGTSTIQISIPEAIKSIGPDGFVALSDDINKVQIGPNSYLRIIDKNGMVSKEWQNSSEFHNTSIWQVNGAVPNGDRINVANFQYAEVDFINQNDIPYPYEKGTILETINGENIIWNQLLDKSEYPATTTSSGVTFTNNGDGSITVDGTADAAANAIILVGKNLSVIQGHKYYATMSKPIEHADFWFGLYDNSEDQPFQRGTILDRNGRILDCIKSSDTLNCQVVLYKNTSVSNATVKPQLFDLTQMFGAGNEPATPAKFWSYFETNKVYLKNTYLNIVGPFNTNSSKAIRNPMGNNQQPFSFYDNENTAMQCKNGDQLVPFRINQPDKLIWVDNIPAERPKNVVINANGSGVISAPRSVLLNEALIWNDDIIWKDGTYLKNGTGLSAKIGEVRVNGMVVEADTVSGTDPTYTNTGLVKQEKVSMSIKEREALSGYNLSFRIFINTNNFTIDQLRSTCFVEESYTVDFADNWTGVYGSGRMATVKITHGDGTEEISRDNNLNGANFSNVVSVTFTEDDEQTPNESWTIFYEMGGSESSMYLENRSTKTLTLTGNTTFLYFTK